MKALNPGKPTGWKTPEFKSWLPSRRAVVLILDALFALAGAALVLLGVGLVYPPASIILAGVGLLALVWFINVE